MSANLHQKAAVSMAPVQGIFMQYLSFLYNSHLEISQGMSRTFAMEEETKFLSACESFFVKQASSIWNSDRDGGRNTLGLHWGGPHVEASASTQGSALDALNAAIPF